MVAVDAGRMSGQRQAVSGSVSPTREAADHAAGDAGGRVDLEEAGAAVGAAEEARTGGGDCCGAAPHPAHGTGTTGKGRGSGTGHHGMDTRVAFWRATGGWAWAAADEIAAALDSPRSGPERPGGPPCDAGSVRWFEALDRSRRCGSVTCGLYPETVSSVNDDHRPGPTRPCVKRSRGSPPRNDLASSARPPAPGAVRRSCRADDRLWPRSRCRGTR